MAVDRNGRELAVGQRVRIEGTVSSVFDSEAFARIINDDEPPTYLRLGSIELIDPPTTCPPAPAEASLGPDELLVMAAETDGMRPPPDDEEDIGSMVFEP